MHVGEVGSMHDARVFRRSPVCRRMAMDDGELFEMGEHIIGHTAYPLMDTVRNLLPRTVQISIRTRDATTVCFASTG